VQAWARSLDIAIVLIVVLLMMRRITFDARSALVMVICIIGLLHYRQEDRAEGLPLSVPTAQSSSRSSSSMPLRCASSQIPSTCLLDEPLGSAPAASHQW